MKTVAQAPFQLAITLVIAVLVMSLRGGFAHATEAADLSRWRDEARQVQIVRDDWGIAHVHGKTDADAVFGMIYAQAEDDFSRVETNYLNAMGRLAEAEGESAIYRDLRMKLFIGPIDLKAKYTASPAWLKRLMGAWADGLNFYLYQHPQTTPRVIRRFEPWMALSFSEGSIGGDIESVSLKELEAFYGERKPALLTPAEPSALFKEPRGSNGIAIAPANTVNHHALLLINPHTSFYFRAEQQVTSDQGLDAYGAATWGQFFLYQGFNERVGWMHTSTTADAVDEFAETIVKKDGQLFYRYGAELRPVTVSTIVVPYRTAGGMQSKTFTVFRTHHGSIVRSADGRWISVALMQKPVEALSQSFLLTKARTYAAFMQVMALKANSSNNTVYADADGNIAYLHPQFIPRRDNRFDYTQPVDGADPATDWQGVHALNEAPHLLNPANGWIMNTNDGPWSAAGSSSPKQADYPRYMDAKGENPRGLHATRLLTGKTDFNLDRLQAAAFDSYLPAFAQLIPPLIQAYDNLAPSSPYKTELKDQIAALRAWDNRWGLTSTETSLAVFWGEDLWKSVEAEAKRANVSIYDYMAGQTTPEQKLASLKRASDRLTHDFGAWKTPWGEINRFQRLNDDIAPSFDDTKPSIPVKFTSAQWGSLASFGAHAYPNTKKYYGSSGNSLVAVVEFGDKVRARAVTAGGESGDPASPHFGDQAARYASGDLRDVYFYPADLAKHVERSYHPGE